MAKKTLEERMQARIYAVAEMALVVDWTGIQDGLLELAEVAGDLALAEAAL